MREEDRHCFAIDRHRDCLRHQTGHIHAGHHHHCAKHSDIYQHFDRSRHHHRNRFPQRRNYHSNCLCWLQRYLYWIRIVIVKHESEEFQSGVDEGLKFSA